MYKSEVRMQETTPIQLLKDPELSPDESLLKGILNKDCFEIIQNIFETFTELDIGFEWRYYKDGKAWLGKATQKKKTIVWISVWDNFIKTSFYFTVKTRQGVLDLDLNTELKTSFMEIESKGKLIPLILDVKDKATLNDFVTILIYKKNS